MIRKNYVVNGEDVDDCMVMEDASYLSYALRLLHYFLFEKGYSKEKLNRLKLDLKAGDYGLVSYKKLMFTEQFSVEMNYCYKKEMLNVKSYYFNSQNFLCAELNLKVYWCNNNCGEIIAMPKQIRMLFHDESNSF